jgi:plasminogen activator
MTTPLAADESRKLWDGGAIRASVSLGKMSGEANKYLNYTQGPRKGEPVSRLRWDFDNITVLTGELGITVTPGIEILVKGRTGLDQSSHLLDEDYGQPFCPAVNGDTLCRSEHPNTDVDQALMGDLALAADLADWDGFRLRVMGGYRHEHYEWSAIGGTANYTVFPQDQLLITYEQTWSAPYLGMEARYEEENWSLAARLTGSLWAKADDHDEHVWSLGRFVSKFDDGRMLGVSLAGTYRVDERMSLTLDYEFQHWPSVDGDVELYNYAIGAGGYIGKNEKPSTAGLTTHTVSAGVSVQF